MADKFNSPARTVHVRKNHRVVPRGDGATFVVVSGTKALKTSGTKSLKTTGTRTLGTAINRNTISR